MDNWNKMVYGIYLVYQQIVLLNWQGTLGKANIVNINNNNNNNWIKYVTIHLFLFVTEIIFHFFKLAKNEANLFTNLGAFYNLAPSPSL